MSRPGQSANGLQIAREAEDGVRRLPAGSGHLRDGVEDLEYQRVHVDDEQRLRHLILKTVRIFVSGSEKCLVVREAWPLVALLAVDLLRFSLGRRSLPRWQGRTIVTNRFLRR